MEYRVKRCSHIHDSHLRQKCDVCDTDLEVKSDFLAQYRLDQYSDSITNYVIGGLGKPSDHSNIRTDLIRNGNISVLRVKYLLKAFLAEDNGQTLRFEHDRRA